jgi:Calcineurin-like phosphoesterase
LAKESNVSISIDPLISSRIKAAWNQLTPAQQAQIAQALHDANQQAVVVSQTRRAPPAPAAAHSLMLAQSALTDDSDGVLNALEADVVIDVGPDGVIWGTGKWEQLDPGWAEAFAVFLESLLPLFGGKHPFIDNPQSIPIPDSVTIGIIGDWGTGDWRGSPNPAPSTDVRKTLALLNPDITIHLGDVYYAGTSDQELHSFMSIWPRGLKGSFALNSNHEMYSGSKPYFNAINNPPFDQQKGCSYFMLENNNWVIVGLDSAYFSPEGQLRMNGLLFPSGQPNKQNSFLLAASVNAQQNGKKLILLTHHNGLDLPGVKPNELYEQVVNAFPPGTAPAYWYWGHEHAAAVYQPFAPTGVLCRCCGHGALPWGQSSDLAGSPNVVWHENRLANDPDVPERVYNGFAVFQLEGPSIQERFYDENGGIAWKNP